MFLQKSRKETQTMIFFTHKAAFLFVWNFTWIIFFGRTPVKEVLVTSRKTVVMFACLVFSICINIVSIEKWIFQRSTYNKLVSEMQALGCIKTPSADPLRKVDAAVGAAATKDAASDAKAASEVEVILDKSSKKKTVPGDGVSKR